MIGLILTGIVVGICGAAVGSTIAVLTDDTRNTEEHVVVNAKYVEKGLWIGFATGALIGGGSFYFLTKPSVCCVEDGTCEEEAGEEEANVNINGD